MKDFTSAAASWSPAAASVLFELLDYCVIAVVGDDGDDGEDGGGRESHRIVRVVATATERVCPGCGPLTSRVRQRTTQRLRDVLFEGAVTV